MKTARLGELVLVEWDDTYEIDGDTWRNAEGAAGRGLRVRVGRLGRARRRALSVRRSCAQHAPIGRRDRAHRPDPARLRPPCDRAEEGAMKIPAERLRRPDA